MTPSQQRILLYSLLAVGVLVVITATIIALTRSRRDIQIDAPADKVAASGGFSFFDVDRTSVLTDGLREKLSEALGSDAIAHSAPLDLTVIDQDFLRAHLPVLYELNQRLNPPFGERREHATTRLTYHRAERHAMPFRYIELLFSNLDGRPLYFLIQPSEDFSDSIATLTSKYGPPREIQTDGSLAPVRMWEKKGDFLVATSIRRRNGRLVQELRIYYVDNLRRLLESEEEALRQQDRSTRKAGEGAF